jgi:hypothetical protein
MQTWQQYYAVSDQISGKIVNGYLARKGISGFEVMHGPRARACGGTSPAMIMAYCHATNLTWDFEVSLLSQGNNSS